MRGWMTTVAATLLLGGCLQPARIEADDAWVRLPAVPGRPAAGYFTLHGGAEGATLIAVSADRAIRTEMHATMMHGGAMTMRPLAAVPLAAEGEVRFAPGGRHLMLFGLSPTLAPGRSTILTFSFADGTRVQRKASVIGASDPAPN